MRRSTSFDVLKMFWDERKSLASSPIRKKKSLGEPTSAPKLLIYLDDEKAITPTKAYPNSAGFDLFSIHDATIPAQGKVLIDTGIIIKPPEGTYGRIASRSGLASTFSIMIGAGVVDENYRGRIKILMFNLSNCNYYVKTGDRVAQLICEKLEHPEIVQTSHLPTSERGANAFGSSGQ